MTSPTKSAARVETSATHQANTRKVHPLPVGVDNVVEGSVVIGQPMLLKAGNVLSSQNAVIIRTPTATLTKPETIWIL